MPYPEMALSLYVLHYKDCVYDVYLSYLHVKPSLGHVPYILKPPPRILHSTIKRPGVGSASSQIRKTSKMEGEGNWQIFVVTACSGAERKLWKHRV